MLTAEINRSRKLGVEHEFYVPVLGNMSREGVQDQIANILTQNGIRALARPYSHTLLPSNFDVAVETDGSISPTHPFAGTMYCALEIKTRILTYDEYEALLPRILAIIAHLSGRVNASCGYHVHIGVPEVRHRDGAAVVRSLYNLFHRFEPVLFGLQPPSRWNNTYCRKMENRSRLLHKCHSLESVKRALSGWDRYYAWNCTTLFESNPHLELRHGAGTLEVAKARHWLRTCLQLVEHAITRSCQSGEPVECNRQGLASLLTTCGFKPNSRVYGKVSAELRDTGRYLLMKRWRAFHGPQACPPGMDSENDGAPVF